mgnify:FL=1
MELEVYNPPRLFAGSETLREEFDLPTNRKKALAIYEKKASNVIEPFLKDLESQGAQVQAIIIDEDTTNKDMNEVLYSQKMGTQLFIASDWHKARDIFDEAVEAGFTEDEIQTYITGEKSRDVYCMKCFSLTEIGTEEEEIDCGHCGAGLEVGPFFSKIRKGYIGYPLPAKQN